MTQKNRPAVRYLPRVSYEAPNTVLREICFREERHRGVTVGRRGTSFVACQVILLPTTHACMYCCVPFESRQSTNCSFASDRGACASLPRLPRRRQGHITHAINFSKRTARARGRPTFAGAKQLLPSCAYPKSYIPHCCTQKRKLVGLIGG